MYNWSSLQDQLAFHKPAEGRVYIHKFKYISTSQTHMNKDIHHNQTDKNKHSAFIFPKEKDLLIHCKDGWPGIFKM